MADKKGVVQSADNGINTGAHPANLPQGMIIDCKNMFVRGRGRIQQARFPTRFSSYAVLDQLVSPTYSEYISSTAPVDNLDDATFSGYYNEVAPPPSFVKIKVEITFAGGGGDSFDWYIDTGSGYGAPTGPVPIIGGAIALASTGVSVTFGATTGHTVNDYWEYHAVPIAVTNGSATVTSTVDLTDTNIMTHPLKVGCGLYYKDGPFLSNDYEWYRVTAVASDGLSFTLDREFNFGTQGLTQSDARDQEHFITYPVTAVINWDNTNDEEQTCAVAGKYLRRWNGAGWDTEFTLNSWNERGMFLDYRGQCFFTNGSDEMLIANTGDGDWESPVDPVIEQITVTHEESGHHLGIAEFVDAGAGIGYEDALFSGNYTGGGTGNARLYIEIDSVTGDGVTKDTYKWKLDPGTGTYGAETTGVSCEKDETTVTAGLKVRFRFDGSEWDGGATTVQRHAVGDNYTVYAPYEAKEYNVTIKDTLLTPTKAIILSGEVEGYNIGNGKETVAAVIMRSQNKGSSWSTIHINYLPYETADVRAHAGGLYQRRDGDIVGSVASQGNVPNANSKFKANKNPITGESDPEMEAHICYVITSSDDGETWTGRNARVELTGYGQNVEPGTHNLLSWDQANQNILVYWSDYYAARLKMTDYANDQNLVCEAYSTFAEAINTEGEFLFGAGVKNGRSAHFSSTSPFNWSENPIIENDFHVGRPIMFGPVYLYDANAVGDDKRRQAIAYWVQGNPQAPNTNARYSRIVWHTGKNEVSETLIEDEDTEFDYGTGGLTPKGYPYFVVDNKHPRFTKDVGVLGTGRGWGGFYPLRGIRGRFKPILLWTNPSDNFSYGLCIKNVYGTPNEYRLVLAVSQNEGESYNPVWQDQENDFNDVEGAEQKQILKRVHHWNSNEFIVSTEDSPYMYRCRYHVNAPKCKNLMVWRQRLLAYGEMLDLVSPRGATADNLNVGDPTTTLEYLGMDWADDELVGHRLYPDINGNPDLYYTIISNDNNSVTVAENLYGIISVSKVFEIRRYAPQRIRWSQVSRFDTWEPIDNIDEDDAVTAIRQYLETGFETPQSGLLVLMEEGHALYLGDSPNTWIRYSGKTQRGCIGNYAIAENILLSHDALSVVNNGAPQPLAGRLDTTLLQETSPSLFIETLDETYKTESMGFLGKGMEFLCVPTNGSPWLDKAIVLDVMRGGFWTIDFPTYGGNFVFVEKSVLATSYPVPVCAFSDKSGFVIYAGCASGQVWKLFDSKTGFSIGDQNDTTSEITIPLNLGAPEEWFGVEKVGFYFYVAESATLSYRFNPNMSGWTAWDTKSLAAGMNRVIISAPQPMEGNTIALQLKVTTTGHAELNLPIEFSAQLKHSGIEEG